MPEAKSPRQDDKPTGSKTGWIVPVVVAAIPVIGTILVAYFTYILPLRMSLQATQTAEARPSPSLTFSPSPSATATESAASPSPTSSPTPLEPSLTPTIPPSGVKYCVDIAAVNVRNGPGMEYDIIAALPQDDCIFFDGQFLYGDGYYWARISPNQAGFAHLAGGWVYGGALRPQDFDRLPPVTAPPLPYHTPTPGF